MMIKSSSRTYTIMYIHCDENMMKIIHNDKIYSHENKSIKHFVHSHENLIYMRIDVCIIFLYDQICCIKNV